MAPYFGIRSGFCIKLDKTTKLTPGLFNPCLIHYFQHYRDVYRFIFQPSFATPNEQRLIKEHQLDLVIYTDGGQRNSNDGAWAYSINDDQRQLYFDAQYFNTKNNNYCELEAAIRVLRKLIQFRLYNQRILLNTDSVSVRSITHNVRHGMSIQSIARHTEWKISQLRDLKHALHRFTHLHVQLIKGHSGILGNQLVHQLCSKAMSSLYSDSYDPFKVNKIDYLKNNG